MAARRDGPGPIGEALRLLLALSLAVALLATVEATFVVAADSDACRVRNTSSGRVDRRLGRAVRFARAGDRLIVTGTCGGGAVIYKTLVLRGGSTERIPTLERDGLRALVLRPNANVRLVGLRIEGIKNKGVAVLRDVRVRGARDYGVRNTGVMRIRDSYVLRNKGGAYNAGRLVLTGSTRVKGSAGSGSGFSIINRGTLVMRATSSVSGSGAGCCFRAPSGIGNSGALIMEGASSITDGYTGVRNEAGGDVTMDDRSSISGNTAHGAFNEGTFRMLGSSSIHDNRDGSSIYWAGYGAGVYNKGTLIMEGASSIHDNHAASHAGEAGMGGGVFNDGGVLTGVRCPPQANSNVYANTPDDCHPE